MSKTADISILILELLLFQVGNLMLLLIIISDRFVPCPYLNLPIIEPRSKIEQKIAFDKLIKVKALNSRNIRFLLCIAILTTQATHKRVVRYLNIRIDYESPLASIIRFPDRVNYRVHHKKYKNVN